MMTNSTFNTTFTVSLKSLIVVAMSLVLTISFHGSLMSYIQNLVMVVRVVLTSLLCNLDGPEILPTEVEIRLRYGRF